MFERVQVTMAAVKHFVTHGSTNAGSFISLVDSFPQGSCLVINETTRLVDDKKVEYRWSSRHIRRHGAS